MGTVVRADVVNRGLKSSRRVALISLVAMIVLASCGLVFTIFALEIQSGARAYVTGNGLWSKAHLQATYYLSRYSYSGREEDLQQARQSLAIPLGDRDGRLALDAEPPDLEAARRGFLVGANHPEDIDNLIWMYRYFSDYLFFREAVEIWREADQSILALDRIADELEAEYNSAQSSTDRIADLRRQLVGINQGIRPLDIAFTETLANGSRWLKSFLSAISFIVLFIVIAGAAVIFIWANRNIARSEDKFRATFQHAAVGMAQLRADESFIDVNDSLCHILQRSREALLNTSLAEITHQPDRSNDAENFRALMQGDIQSYAVEKRLLRMDDSLVWCKLTLSRIGSHMDFPHYLIAVFEDVSEARRLSSELSYQATHDSLTGIINRVEFERRLDNTIQEAAAQNTHHTLCFIDLDQFKVVNDTCGHMAGDELLRHVSVALQQQLRRGDVLARLGGDEFGIIFVECDIEAAGHVAEKLRNALSNFSFVWEGARFTITASMGLVEIDAHTSSAGMLLKAADTACYSAKDHGRNQIHVYSETDLMLAARRNEMEWVSRIREALTHDRLHLAAQCIQSLHADQCKRYEFLVRLVDLDGTVVMPNTFLPAAERYNIATLIDRWVVNTSMVIMQEYPDFIASLEAIHINLSGQSISREEFLRYIEGLLDTYQVPANKICFEITETAAMSSLFDARHFIESLRERGCQFALDDFGSGLSSFGYLRSLPVDIVKIDGSFVRNLNNDEVHLAMVRSIAEICRIMDKLVVAEFVDSEETIATLTNIGIHYGQGYAIHKPCKLDELLIKTRHGTGHTLPGR